MSLTIEDVPPFQYLGGDFRRAILLHFRVCSEYNLWPSIRQWDGSFENLVKEPFEATLTKYTVSEGHSGGSFLYATRIMKQIAHHPSKENLWRIFVGV